MATASKVRLLTAVLSAAVVMATAIPNYCFPGDQCWPRARKVDKLAESLTGELLQPSDPRYSNYSLMEDSYFDRFPGIIVLVQSADDVIKSIRFARKYDIRLTVFSCGHDYSGRSTANGSLQINFSHMKAILVKTNDPRSRTGASVRIQSGANWREVYAEVDKFKKQVTGAYATGVCVAGYTMGGGIGVISRSYGLAVDNIVEFDIVLRKGTIATCSASGTRYRKRGRERRDRDTSLFWAVRGGGGGTYGIVLSFTYVLHNPPAGMVGYRVQYPNDINGDKSIGRDVLQFILDYFPTLPKSWGGFILLGPVFGPPVSYSTAITINIIANAPWDSPDIDAIQPLVNFKPSSQLSSVFTNYSSMYEYQKLSRHRSHFRSLTAEALYKTRPDNSAMITYLTEHAPFSPIPGTFPGTTIAFVGGQISQCPTESAAISHDFRSSNFYVMSWRVWFNAANDDDVKNEASLLDDKLAKIGKGAYLNEAFYEAKDWEERFWGENYCRLRWIKQLYDPCQFFYCHHCVRPFQCKHCG